MTPSYLALTAQKLIAKTYGIWLTPMLLRNQYTNELLSIANKWIRIIEDAVFTAIPTIVPTIKMDSSLGFTIDRAEGMFISVVNTEVPVKAEKIARSVNKFNKRQAAAVFNLDESFIPDYELDFAIHTFVNRNVRLVKGLSQEVSRKLEQRIESCVHKGYNAQQIEKSIRYGLGVDKGVFKTIKTRMALIAVDQVGKLDGQLTQLRQELLGIKEYYWRGMLDSRERPCHKDREGKVYKWSKPPKDGHPGQPIRCRCKAQPKIK
jgi:SPP1 gp7 family putative phage head morphogenesis protein